MELLESPIRGYAWGSHTAIAAIQGRPEPTPAPEAELWMGAHPDAPSRIATTGRPLTDVISADPEGVLGAGVARRFGARLPFLLKVLAAAQPLSLQAHPDLAQARAGYAVEEAAGVHRNYVDPWHKPEMLVAVAPFDALCGFREPAESAALLGGLGVPALKSTVDALLVAEPEVGLREAVHGLLSLPGDERAALVAAVVAAAGDQPAYALVRELADRYPGDIGVVVAMLLNRVRLAPEEAVWMPAGNLHAYLRGVGVEIMAASDNVLRGGLTPKRVDVAELLRVLRFEVLADPVMTPIDVSPGVVTWPVPVDDFALYRVSLGDDVTAARLPGDGPRIVFCLDGTARIDDGVAPISLRAGQAAFAPAGRALSASGRGTIFQAITP